MHNLNPSTKEAICNETTEAYWPIAKMHFRCIAGSELACHAIHQRSKDVALIGESELSIICKWGSKTTRGFRPGFETEGGHPKEVQNRDIEFS